jgi:hypothetical protein
MKMVKKNNQSYALEKDVTQSWKVFGCGIIGSLMGILPAAMLIPEVYNVLPGICTLPWLWTVLVPVCWACFVGWPVSPIFGQSGYTSESSVLDDTCSLQVS